MPALRIGVNSFSFVWKETVQVFLRRLNDMDYSHFDILTAPHHCWPPDFDAADRTALKSLADLLDIRIESTKPRSKSGESDPRSARIHFVPLPRID